MADAPANNRPTPDDSQSGVVLSGMSGASGLSTASGGRERETFAADELAIVLSHYDIGVIEAVQEFPRGSRRAPKSVIKAESGYYLLKRRAAGKDEAFRVAFAHSIQLYLSSKQFPLPHLIGTRRDNNSMLQWRGAIYELFEFIRGVPYDASLEATAESGKVMALFHKLLLDYQPDYDPPTGSYHESRSVQMAFDRIPKTLLKVAPETTEARRAELDDLVGSLRDSYNHAAASGNDIGLNDWPPQIIHSDWHPGNMLFRGPRIVAVIDYDASRQLQRVQDLANGALQFSMIGGKSDPEHWPDHLDLSRFKRFLRAYDAVPDCVLSRAELRTTPWLMMEALIAESVIPIANSGQFARMDGFKFLRMVQRKVAWLREHEAELAGVLEA